MATQGQQTHFNLVYLAGEPPGLKFAGGACHLVAIGGIAD